MQHHSRRHIEHLPRRQRQLFHTRKPKHPEPVHRKVPPQAPGRPTETLRAHRVPSVRSHLRPLQRAHIHVDIPQNAQSDSRGLQHAGHADSP